jgi:hypothetical protein
MDRKQTQENKQAILENARLLYEGKEAIYLEKGALRVRVKSIGIRSVRVNTTNDALDYMEFALEEIPTPGLPVWLQGSPPTIGPHPHRFKVGAPFEIPLFHDSCSATYVWSMYFSPKLVGEVVEMATNFAGDSSPELYRKISGHISLHDT